MRCHHLKGKNVVVSMCVMEEKRDQKISKKTFPKYAFSTEYEIHEKYKQWFKISVIQMKTPSAPC